MLQGLLAGNDFLNFVDQRLRICTVNLGTSTQQGYGIILTIMNDNRWLDRSLYPDIDPPDRLDTLSDQVDFLARLCAAWDFGILPEESTVIEIRKTEWNPAIDTCRLLTSPAYHLLRSWHHLSRLPYMGQDIALIRDDPCLSQV